LRATGAQSASKKTQKSGIFARFFHFDRNSQLIFSNLTEIHNTPDEE